MKLESLGTIDPELLNTLKVNDEPVNTKTNKFILRKKQKLLAAIQKAKFNWREAGYVLNYSRGCNK